MIEDVESYISHANVPLWIVLAIVAVIAFSLALAYLIKIIDMADRKARRDLLKQDSRRKEDRRKGPSERRKGSRRIQERRHADAV